MPRWPDPNEIEMICFYATGRRFLMETGSGKTTKYLNQVAIKNEAKFWSIDISSKWQTESGVSYFTGWSIDDCDIIGLDHPDFIDHPNTRCRYKHPDRKWVVNRRKLPQSKDGIRTICRLENDSPDYFFCDTGEYCGLSEFNVISKLMNTGSIFVCHDTKYPKSIKGFKIARLMKENVDWEVIDELDSRRGLIVGKKK